MVIWTQKVGLKEEYPINWRRVLGDAEIEAFSFDVPTGLRLAHQYKDGTTTYVQIHAEAQGDYVITATIKKTDLTEEAYPFTIRVNADGMDEQECIIPELQETPIQLIQGCTTTIPITIDPPFPAKRAIMYVRRSHLGRLIAEFKDLRLTHDGGKLYVNIRAAETIAIPAATLFYGIRLVGEKRQCEIAKGVLEVVATMTMPQTISYSPKYDQYARYHANKELCEEDECPAVCAAPPKIWAKNCSPAQCRPCAGSDKLVFFVSSDGLDNVEVDIPHGIYRVVSFTGNGYVKDIDFSTHPKRARVEVTNFCEEICQNGYACGPMDACDCPSTYTYPVRIKATDVCGNETEELFEIRYTPPVKKRLPDNVPHRVGVRYSYT